MRVLFVHTNLIVLTVKYEHSKCVGETQRIRLFTNVMDLVGDRFLPTVESMLLNTVATCTVATRHQIHYCLHYI